MANDKIKFSTGTVVDEDGYLHQVGTKITATAAELNAVDGISADVDELNQMDGVLFNTMVSGSGILSSANSIVEHRVTKIGGIFKTEILIDLTDFGCGDAANDIIGDDGGAANCHIGQILAAVNGTIIAGKIECHEAPTGGDPDINLYCATEATGAENADVTGLTETELANCGDHSVGSIDVLTAWPAANQYLYLACGTATEAAYTAGRLLITLWGV